MKNLLVFMAVVLFPAFVLTSCDKDDNESKGILNLSITDAPVDSDDVKGVYITVTGIHYHTSSNGWIVIEEFEGPRKFNLLDLQRGESEMLGSFELEAGKHTQIRFLLDAPERGGGPPSNPGCYIEFTDGSTQDLFVPSGSETGYKAVGSFTVPANQQINITADFDVRKSVIKAGNSGKYLLKPTIRLVVDNQAGSIAGEVYNIPEDKNIVVYAYEEDTWDISEADLPEEETARFPNSVSSDLVCENNQYHIAFLAPIIYDLVVVATDEEGEVEVLGIIENIPVESNKTSDVTIDIDEL